MPLLGAHMSIAGGLHFAFDRIKRVNGEALQIFSSNQRQWNAPPLTREECISFKRAWEAWDGGPIAVHNSYLVNLASANEEVREKSVRTLTREIIRTALLGIPYLIMHPGSHGGAGTEKGLQRVIRGLDRAVKTAAGCDRVTILLENTAGQGTGLGSDFQELAHIIKESAAGHRLGVCLDTCHLFAAGYDIRSSESYKKTMDEFDSLIGLERLLFFHLNESRRGLGNRVDRHDHIGAGMIGIRGFRNLLQDRRFQNHPMVLETPKGKELKNDQRNLAVLRSLLPSAD